MHRHNIEKWQHSHDFSFIHEKGETRTKQVLTITALTMVVEIIAGSIYGSMALIADGWHMATHAAAFGLTIFAYRYSRRHTNNKEFTFGTGKVSVLGGFASAISLAAVALFMVLESVERFFSPITIHFNEAIFVAILGLIVNIVCALLLQNAHTHHDAQHNQRHHDHNLKAAYMHVLADALTSLLAIFALLFGKFFGLNWLDPLMGIVGALVIIRWSYGLVVETSAILLDRNMNEEIEQNIQNKIESEDDNKVSDIHVWKVGPGHYAAIISIVTHAPKGASHYKNMISEFSDISHLTIEVNECD
jgi:cation diffusion facilitator family transporter